MQELLPTLLAKTDDLSMWGLITEASLVVQIVMIILCLMSVTGWYIIGFKYLYISRATAESEAFIESFWRSSDIEAIYKTAQTLRRSPVSSMFLAGYTELAKLNQDQGRDRNLDADLENIERALNKAQNTETTKLESLVSFLATSGSAAPFIGLFGTVWGIMNSFREIGAAKSATIATVAPGIAEALVATAIGLVAAIPAVMAYNYFVRAIRLQVSDMETFEKDYLNIIRRHFLK